MTHPPSWTVSGRRCKRASLFHLAILNSLRELGVEHRDMAQLIRLIGATVTLPNMGLGLLIARVLVADNLKFPFGVSQPSQP